MDTLSFFQITLFITILYVRDVSEHVSPKKLKQSKICTNFALLNRFAMGPESIVLLIESNNHFVVKAFDFLKRLDNDEGGHGV